MVAVTLSPRFVRAPAWRALLLYAAAGFHFYGLVLALRVMLTYLHLPVNQALWSQRRDCAVVVIDLVVCWAQCREYVRRRRAARRGRCPQCGYILLGLPENRCPECGRAFHPDEIGVSGERLSFETSRVHQTKPEAERSSDGSGLLQGGAWAKWILPQSLAVGAVGLMILEFVCMRLWLDLRIAPLNVGWPQLQSMSSWRHYSELGAMGIEAGLHFIVACLIARDRRWGSDG